VAADREEGRHHRELNAMAGTTLYASIGARLTQYAVDVEGASLAERGAVTLPVGVQYAWRHASKPFVYVACSDGGLGKTGTRHCVCALRMDSTGALSPHGEPVPLRWRPVHISTDRDSRHVLIAYNAPSGVTVLRIRDDGTLGGEVPQDPFKVGKTAHQILVMPSNDRAILPVRGTDAEHGQPEDPGSVEVFDYRDGILTHRQSIAPGGGMGFGPRHVDFHPGKPWMYASIERQNELAMFGLAPDTVTGPLFRKTALARPHDVRARQLGGAVHVHPSGRFAYMSNRADGTVEDAGTPVFNGGENTLAVYALDDATGEPTLIHTVDTRGMHVRTFHIDPSGRILVAANMTTRAVRQGAAVRTVAAGLSVFRIGADGHLDFVRKHDVDIGPALMFWMGMMALP
jgi:6-phosphogluconolactonase